LSLQGFLGEYTDIRARMHTLGGLSMEEGIHTLRQLVSGVACCADVLVAGSPGIQVVHGVWGGCEKGGGAHRVDQYSLGAFVNVICTGAACYAAFM
jgi:hypothetical protein